MRKRQPRRRAHELRLEHMLRREIRNSVAGEVAALRAEIAELRSELLEKVGGQLRLERIETTRVIGSDLEALQHEVRQLKAAAQDAGFRIADANHVSEPSRQVVERGAGAAGDAPDRRGGGGRAARAGRAAARRCCAAAARAASASAPTPPAAPPSLRPSRLQRPPTAAAPPPAPTPAPEPAPAPPSPARSAPVPTPSPAPAAASRWTRPDRSGCRPTPSTPPKRRHRGRSPRRRPVVLPLPPSPRPDDFADLPRIRPFTDFELDPIEAKVLRRRGLHRPPPARRRRGRGRRGTARQRGRGGRPEAPARRGGRRRPARAPHRPRGSLTVR